MPPPLDLDPVPLVRPLVAAFGLVCAAIVLGLYGRTEFNAL
jgi:hypothetical protein